MPLPWSLLSMPFLSAPFPLLFNSLLILVFYIYQQLHIKIYKFDLIIVKICRHVFQNEGLLVTWILMFFFFVRVKIKEDPKPWSQIYNHTDTPLPSSFHSSFPNIPFHHYYTTNCWLTPTPCKNKIVLKLFKCLNSNMMLFTNNFKIWENIIWIGSLG